MPRNDLTKLPANEALQALQEDKDWSIRDLSTRLQDRFDGWGSPALIANYRTGKQKMSLTAMERLALILQTEPTVFAEYRLALARAQLDPDQVGLTIALRNLDRFDR